MKIEKVNLSEKFEKVTEPWSPKIVGELNKQMVKIAKFEGEFVMHEHEHEDELFFVHKGKLFIELIDKTLELDPGEFVVIPRGVKHKPYVTEETEVMMFEPATTVNTGNVKSDRTVRDLESL